MSNNIGKLTTPSGEGASIECTSNYLKDNETEVIIINNIGTLRSNTSNLYKSLELTSDPNEWASNGAYISLRSSLAGYSPSVINLLSSLNGNITSLEIFPNGDIVSYIKNSTDGTQHHRNIESIYSFSNNHIQYTNGLAICWLFVSNTGTSAYTFTLPIAFKDTEYRCFGCDTGSARYSVAVQKLSTSSVNIYCGEGTWGVNVLAIGRWK